MQIKKSGPDDLKKATGAGTAAITGFAGMVHPLLGIAVGMAAAYFGPAIERRQDRAKELIQYVQDHIAEFTLEILDAIVSNLFLKLHFDQQKMTHYSLKEPFASLVALNEFQSGGDGWT